MIETPTKNLFVCLSTPIKRYNDIEQQHQWINISSFVVVDYDTYYSKI